MAVFPIHNYYLFNGNLEPVNQYKPDENTGSVYEVIRIVRGVPLFLSDHLQRFMHSAELAQINIDYSDIEIEESLLQLIKSNQVSEGNILISCKENLSAFFIPHKYPGQVLYEKGIQLGILHAERQNPNAKVFQTSVRQQADEMKLANDFYEVLLVDHLNRITEGSSSNVFFVKQNKIITPPSSEILEGITRKKAILLAQKLNIDVEERSIYMTELASFESAFITGTSPKILPVKQIDAINYDPGNLLTGKLIAQYEMLTDEYISGR